MSVTYKPLINLDETKKIILPFNEINKQIDKINKLTIDQLNEPRMRKIAEEVLERSERKLYNYIPYYNRSNNSPGWQWHYMAAASKKFKKKGRVALGANRIGKSEQGAYESVLAVIGKHPFREFPENGKAWIVGLDNPMIRDIDRPLFESFLPERFKYKFYKQDNLWEIKGEGREWIVYFKSTEMGREKFQGAQIDFCWIDEEPKKIEIWTEIETRLVDRAGIWWMTATPVNGTKWLKSLSERKNVYKTMAGMKENPHLPLDEIVELEKNLPEDEVATRILGEYVTFGGRPVFDRKILRDLAEETKGIMFKEGMLSTVK
jgi:phage terminase large subunit-like protein